MPRSKSVTGVPLSGRERRQIWQLGGAVALLHVLGWGTIWFVVAPHYPFMLGLAGLAYAFGLRHAFDADHIAAIDNTTRKLMRGGPRPLGVGFFFSLGHSSVVLLMTLVVALATQHVTAELPRLHAIGQYVGTVVSGAFLYLIGILNLLVMIDIYRVFRDMRRGEVDPDELEARLLQRGLMSRWFGRLFDLVSRPWHMYVVGFLFGLGFDTATEIGLLTTAGLAASQALPFVAVLALPIVFAAGMSLMDSADGIVMCGAYGWAFSNPVRKVFYNLTVTGLSVVVALFVGTIELASIVGGLLHVEADGPRWWQALQHLDLQTMGYAVVALFVCSWMVSLLIWRVFRIEERWLGAERAAPPYQP
ncbi:MAG: HoxN/HupN/NixA family nickel/cobalt transporter [Acidobacteriota bacterium]|nr:HoxN/HupN/NixA family nickel/cobalt transporter [Acidobacteriota bacterium]